MPEPATAMTAARPAARRLVVWALAACAVAGAQTAAQDITSDRERGLEILRQVERDLRHNYHDPTFRGIDLAALFQEAAGRVRGAGSEAQISAILNQVLMKLDDSHTFFVPPPPALQVDYGFELRMVGERCLVAALKPGSLAQADGLKAGSTVLSIEGVQPTRENLWQIEYALRLAAPRRELHLGLQAPGAAPEQRTVRARVGSRRQYQDFGEWLTEVVERSETKAPRQVRRAALSADVAAVSLRHFSVEPRQIDDVLGKVRGQRALVLDLRGNPGGALEGLARVLGYFFDREFAIGALLERKGRKLLKADRLPPERVFAGRLVVLVDSASASAAEIAARVLQIEKRATILGDRTAGAVMASQFYARTQGHQHRFLSYATSITVADLVLADGRSLEKVGVTPDELVLPSPEDLAAGRDPALARAAALLGVTLDAQAAGAVFPRLWN